MHHWPLQSSWAFPCLLPCTQPESHSPAGMKGRVRTPSSLCYGLLQGCPARSCHLLVSVSHFLSWMGRSRGPSYATHIVVVGHTAKNMGSSDLRSSMACCLTRLDSSLTLSRYKKKGTSLRVSEWHIMSDLWSYLQYISRFYKLFSNTNSTLDPLAWLKELLKVIKTFKK